MKNLPIQFVEFRGRKDDFLTEGGGKDVLQRWIQDDIDICREQSSRVYNQMNSWMELFNERERQHNDLPLLFEVELHQKAEAKSYRRDINAILNPARERNVLGMTGRRKLLVKVNNRRSLQRLSAQFSNDAYDIADIRTLRAYASIESIGLFRPVITDAEDGQMIKIRLADFGDEYYNQKSERHLYQLCERFRQSCDKLDYVSGLRLYKTTITSKDFLGQIATLDGILSVQSMPYMTLNVMNNQWEGEIPSATPQDGINYPLVGLLDSGIEGDLESMRLWMDGDNQIPEEWDPADASKDHGTRVASILLYGDQLCRQERTGTGPCKIRSCVVNTSKLYVPEYECINLIRQAIARNPDIKIWSSSMGSKEEAPLSEFSDYAKVLDQLQQEHEILICKSAGNKLQEKNRITCGADSVLSLVVGATTIEANQAGEYVENWSPVSCIGLAAGSIIKPDLANLGGDSAMPIRLISEYGTIIGDCGTSYAVPRVSATAAALANVLGDKYNPLLVKALLIHNAFYPLGMADEELEERVRKVGFGIPLPINEIVHNDADEITMMFLCHFRKGYEYQVAEFVYPEGLVENGFYYGDITMTMVSNPILNYKQAAEYCQTDVEVGLFTYASSEIVDLMDANTPKTFRNPLRLKGVENVLLDEKYSRKLNGGSDLWECNKIDKQHKFSPIKKFHVNLENMTETNKRNALAENRQWALRLKALYREESENSIAREDLQFDAYLIMTIRDPKKRGVVYNQTMNQLNERNFIHQSIELRQDIEIESGSGE